MQGIVRCWALICRLVASKLHMDTSDEVVAQTHIDVVIFWQGSSMIEESYSNHFWDRSLLCCSLFSDRRLRLFFVEGLLFTACAQTRKYLVALTSASYHSVARYAQALGNTSHSVRRQITSSSIPDGLDWKSSHIKPKRNDHLVSESIASVWKHWTSYPG